MYSQLMKGLPQKKTSETDDYTEDGEQIASPSTGISGRIGQNLLISFEANHTALSNVTADRNYSLSRETIEFMQFDNILDELLNHMKLNNCINNAEYKGFTLVTESFDFYDIESMIRFLRSPYYFKETNKNAIKSLELLRDVLPYKHFALNKNYLIPLNKRYFRTSFKNIQLNYKNDVNVLGVKGSLLSDALKLQQLNIIDNYNEMITKTVIDALGNNDPVLFDPIAIYH